MLNNQQPRFDSMNHLLLLNVVVFLDIMKDTLVDLLKNRKIIIPSLVNNNKWRRLIFVKVLIYS